MFDPEVINTRRHTAGNLNLQQRRCENTRLLPSGDPTFHQQAVSAARPLGRIATLFQGICGAFSLGQYAGADQVAPVVRLC